MMTEQLPKTDSIEELAHFWDRHDLTDFEDELVEVTDPIFRRAGGTTIQLHLSERDMDRLQQLAGSQGVDYAALVQAWVLEKLQAA